MNKDEFIHRNYLIKQLGFIRKEYSGNFCIECGAELKEAE